MTTNLDSQVRYPTAIEATGKKKPRMIGILDEADLDAVNGGTGYVADAAARAALGVLFNHALTVHEAGEYIRSIPCWN